MTGEKMRLIIFWWYSEVLLRIGTEYYGWVRRMAINTVSPRSVSAGGFAAIRLQPGAVRNFAEFFCCHSVTYALNAARISLVCLTVA